MLFKWEVNLRSGVAGTYEDYDGDSVEIVAKLRADLGLWPAADMRPTGESRLILRPSSRRTSGSNAQPSR